MPKCSWIGQLKTAGKSPKTVITDKLASYLDVRYGKGTEHIQSAPFAVENNTQKIERFHETLKQRTKVMRGLKNIESAHDFIDGWLVHYNYLRPHTALNDKTPAEVAGIDFPYKNWADINSKHKPSVKIVIGHQPRETIRLERTRIGRPPKRVRPRKPVAPKLSKQVLVQQTRGGDVAYSHKRVRGTKLIGRMGRVR